MAKITLNTQVSHEDGYSITTTDIKESGDLGYKFSQDVKAYGNVDVATITETGNSFTVLNTWDGNGGVVDIDTKYKKIAARTYHGDPMHMEVSDDFTTGALGKFKGSQWTTNVGPVNSYYIDRSCNWKNGGFAHGVTNYKSDVWSNDINARLGLLAASKKGHYTQEQIFKPNEGGTWEYNKWWDRNNIIHVKGPYLIGASIKDKHAAKDFGYRFYAYNNDGTATLFYNRTSADKTGFYVDMFYQGNKYPTANTYAYGNTNLNTNLYTGMVGDTYTVSGTVDGG